MKRKTIIISLIGIFVLVILGFAYNRIRTNNVLYSDEEVKTMNQELLNEIAPVFEIETDLYYICDLEEINDILKTSYDSEEEFQTVSQIIYNEYYNKEIEKQSPTTIILLDKELKEVLLLYLDSSEKKVCSRYDLTTNSGWNYEYRD